MRYLCPQMHTLGWKFNIFQAMWENILKSIFFPSYIFLENSTFIHLVIFVDECGKG